MALKQKNAAELAAEEAELAAAARAAEEAEEPKASEEPKPVEEPKAEEPLAMVKVQNLTHSTLYQHSSGLTIGPKAEKPMLDDGWLANQLKARLLKRV